MERDQGWFPGLFPNVEEREQWHDEDNEERCTPRGHGTGRNRRWQVVPSVCPLSETYDWVYILKGYLLLPPALDSLNEPGQGYDCREAAIEAYHAWREAAALPLYWRGLAARTELYPERNAWYLDEIIQLAGGDDSPHLHCGISVQAVVLAAGDEVIAATGNTPDEAIETLYQRVYEWFWKLHDTTCAR